MKSWFAYEDDVKSISPHIYLYRDKTPTSGLDPKLFPLKEFVSKEDVIAMEKALKDLTAMVDHALALGHLGGGSTRGWAIQTLNEANKVLGVPPYENED